jgi:hypothetical protein
MQKGQQRSASEPLLSVMPPWSLLRRLPIELPALPSFVRTLLMNISHYAAHVVT